MLWLHNIPQRKEKDKCEYGYMQDYLVMKMLN